MSDKDNENMLKLAGKVVLKPGRSILHWMRLCDDVETSNKKSNIPVISEKELAKHRSMEDAWTCIQGEVYSISKFLEYHPGGAATIMEGAGIDSTELFQQVHPWVNFKSMLKPFFIGYMSSDVKSKITNSTETDSIEEDVD